MSNARNWAVLALATVAAGCGAQKVLLGTEGSYLFTTVDALALPGEEIPLRARLQAGTFLTDQSGETVSFHLDGRLYRTVETDNDGHAVTSFTPPAPGDYRFTAEVSPVGLRDRPPRPQPLLVACRQADAPMVVVDLDKTVVASGFRTVLIGDPTPMSRSAEVLSRLADGNTIVYLTHRPDHFGPKSRRWLARENYPIGPLLLASVGGFLKGSGTYKTEEIRRLKSRFGNLRIGIGDKISDAQAYHGNGLKAFLILQVYSEDDPEELRELADEIGALAEEVQVVTGWHHIAQALFEGASYGRAAAQHQLRQLARRKEEADRDDDD